MFYAIHNKKQNSKIKRKFVRTKTVSGFPKSLLLFIFNDKTCI